MPIPNPSLDNKRYQEILDEAKKKIGIYSRVWTDHNESDPGITFLELFAWLTETQIYMLNKISNQHYLKFLKLLDVIPRPTPPSPSTLYLTLDGSGLSSPVEIQKGTQFLASNPGIMAMQNDDDTSSGISPILFDTKETIDVLPIQIYQITTVSYQGINDETENSGIDGMIIDQKRFFYAFSNNPIPKRSSFYVGLEMTNNQLIDMLQGHVIKFSIFLYEDDLPAPGNHDHEYPSLLLSNRVQWEYCSKSGPSMKPDWLPLELEEDTTAALTMNGHISFKLPFKEADKHLFPVLSSTRNRFNNREVKELFWIRCRLIENHYEIPPRIHAILLNTVGTRSGILVNRSFRSSGMPDQHFMAQVEKTVFNSSNQTSTTEILEVKSIDRNSNEMVWQQVDDFDSSGPEDLHYVFDIFNKKVTFGNDINSKIPEIGQIITIRFRSADVGWQQGFIPTGTKFRMVSDTSVAATNYFPSSKGLAGESLEFAFARARKELKVPLKAVSSTDFEYIAISTPGLRIARTKAYSPSFPENSVVVIVVPFSFQKLPIPSKGLLNTVLCHLDEHRLITTRVNTVGPQYVGINVYTSVTVKPKSNPDIVKELVVKALDNFFSPISRTPEQNAWPFGRDVFQSEVMAIIEEVEGVECVKDLLLVGSGNLANFESDGGDVIIKNYSLVYLNSCQVNFVSSSEECTNMKNDKHHEKSDPHRNG